MIRKAEFTLGLFPWQTGAPGKHGRARSCRFRLSLGKGFMHGEEHKQAEERASGQKHEDSIPVVVIQDHTSNQRKYRGTNGATRIDQAVSNGKRFFVRQAHRVDRER